MVDCEPTFERALEIYLEFVETLKTLSPATTTDLPIKYIKVYQQEYYEDGTFYYCVSGRATLDEDELERTLENEP